jgi:hypothetical protein
LTLLLEYLETVATDHDIRHNIIGGYNRETYSGNNGDAGNAGNPGTQIILQMVLE